MSEHQSVFSSPPPRRTGGYLIGAGSRGRVVPTPGRLARRRLVINLTKWLLPAVALVLLASIALWPEIEAVTAGTRFAMKNISGTVEGGRLIDARYNGIDQKGRPYTLTTASARQMGPTRYALTQPKGDITLENGTWLMLSSLNGTYFQDTNQLDLVNNVTLYRDDGTVMHTKSATLDLKQGAAMGTQPTHAEGPFGVLDAQGFTVMDKGTSIDFTGPAHVVLNGVGH